MRIWCWTGWGKETNGLSLQSTVCFMLHLIKHHRLDHQLDHHHQLVTLMVKSMAVNARAYVPDTPSKGVVSLLAILCGWLAG